MVTAVRYISRSGNTEKVAKAIAEAVGAKAETADVKLDEQVDVLFVGGALYAGSIDSRLAAFLAALAPETAKKLVFFSTAASPKTVRDKVAADLRARGFDVVEETFHCRGKFLLAHRGRPNEEDLKEAARFAGRFL